MKPQKKAYLALDTSYEQGAMALFVDDEIVYQEIFATKFAHGKLVCQALRQVKLVCDEQNYQLAGLFAGLGPGSFVGVRITLSTLLGFGLATSLPLMGFCSHTALAYSVPHVSNLFYLFMKASGELGYLTAFTNVDNKILPVGVTHVIDAKALPLHSERGTTVLSDQTKKLSSIAGDWANLIDIYGPTPQGIFLTVKNRIKQGSCLDESDFIKPNYIKSPSVSVSKKNYIIGLPVN